MSEAEQLPREAPMDPTNLEYRVQQLEAERLPHRVTQMEFTVTNLQGEVTAVKEIARGIGIKLDTGVEKMSQNFSNEVTKLQTDQAKNQAFIKGVVSVFVIVGILWGAQPIISEILKKFIGN